MKQKRVFLKSRPGANNAPVIDNFGYEENEAELELDNGEMLIQTLYISLDPAVRCRMNEDTGVTYMLPWELGETVLGLGGVGRVIESKAHGFEKGDLVHTSMNWPWISYFKSTADDKSCQLQKVEPALKSTPQLVLSLFGLTGLTAHLGVKEMGHVTSGANQTVVVSGAAGATGNLAGQIAKLLGAGRVVGICGSDAKCLYMKTQLGFDAAINYKTENITQRLEETCPTGIDVYFDNVGGSVSEQIIPQMVNNSHVILCGQIAVYNSDLPYPPPISPQLQSIISEKNITRKRFLVLNFEDKYADSLKQLQAWYFEGKLKVPEFMHEGLEMAGEAFVNMLTSVKQDQVGKQMVHEAS